MKLELIKRKKSKENKRNQMEKKGKTKTEKFKNRNKWIKEKWGTLTKHEKIIKLFREKMSKNKQ